MIDFFEELKRFKPSVEVSKIQEEIEKMENVDIKDILNKILKKEFLEKN